MSHLRDDEIGGAAAEPDKKTALRQTRHEEFNGDEVQPNLACKRCA
jgi:hypothetical protein